MRYYKATMELDKSLHLDDFDLIAKAHGCLPTEFNSKLNRVAFRSGKINDVLAVVDHYKHFLVGKLIVEFKGY